MYPDYQNLENTIGAENMGLVLDQIVITHQTLEGVASRALEEGLSPNGIGIDEADLVFFRTLLAQYGIPSTKDNFESFVDKRDKTPATFLSIATKLNPDTSFYGIPERIRIFIAELLFAANSPKISDEYKVEAGKIAKKYIDFLEQLRAPRTVCLEINPRCQQVLDAIHWPEIEQGTIIDQHFISTLPRKITRNQQFNGEIQVHTTIPPEMITHPGEAISQRIPYNKAATTSRYFY